MTTNIHIDAKKLKKSADYVRYLSLESIERAKSGHPGLPLGCADLGILLYRYILKYNPDKPDWPNRDRFILSAGHGSMLLYSLLYLAGYNMSLNDLENFRQMGSKTPGHPEYDIHLGIETTTGPLGQGIANAVGCAIEGKMLADRFNQNDQNLNIFNYTVYTLMGDGCNMEGISYEAGSLAGHLGLDNLIAIYDSNKISIDGCTDITFTENVGKRYEAQGWHVEYADIKDIEAVFNKLILLRDMREGKPKLLILTTTIGEGLNKKKGKADCHGAPAGIPELVYFIQHSEMKEIFEEKYGKDIVQSDTLLSSVIEKRLQNKEPLMRFGYCEDFVREGGQNGKDAYYVWNVKFEALKKSFPESYNEYQSYFNFSLPGELKHTLLNYKEAKTDATRNISGRVLNICAEKIHQIIGGSADLVGSTKASVEKSPYIIRDDFSGRNIAYGVREHAMGAIGNGLALNRTFIPFSSTFFSFFDYMKPAVRLSSLMKLKHLFIFTHDSIYLGEDGPTHQPIEHLNAMRLIPGFYTFRPANDIETAFSYLYFLEKMDGPAAIIATRQKIAENVFGEMADRQDGYTKFEKGAYVFYETDPNQSPEMIFSASGSELSVALDAAKLVEQRDKKRVRVISIPCLELFNESGNEYKQLLLPAGVPVGYIEASSFRAVNVFNRSDVTIIGIETFGLSAPDKVLSDHFGFNAEAVYNKLKD